MTHEDWLVFVKVIIAAAVIFYLRVWLYESNRAGSWKKGHNALWKKPKTWQLVTVSILWGLILMAFIIAFSIRRPS
jgi:RsiW-degrading membrane proteinase PrsW (M82 family)